MLHKAENGSDDDREYRHISSIEGATDLYVMGFRIERDLVLNSAGSWVQ